MAFVKQGSRSSSPEFSPLAIGEDLAPLPEYKTPTTNSIDFSSLLADNPLKLHEDLKSGCGGQLWPAGMVLATHILRHRRNTLRGAKILELGAGGGLVGLAVALGCQIEPPLYITDQECLLALMEQNIKLNQLQSIVKPLVLDWGEPLPREVTASPPTHVLAADCVYFEPAFPLLIKTLQDLFAVSKNCVVFFCFKKRRRADMHFLKNAKKLFRVEVVDDDDDKKVWERQGIFLYTFKHRMNSR